MCVWEGKFKVQHIANQAKKKWAPYYTILNDRYSVDLHRANRKTNKQYSNNEQLGQDDVEL